MSEEVMDENIIFVERYNDMVDTLIRDFVARLNIESLKYIVRNLSPIICMINRNLLFCFNQKNFLELRQVVRQGVEFGEMLKVYNQDLEKLRDSLFDSVQQLKTLEET